MFGVNQQRQRKKMNEGRAENKEHYGENDLTIFIIMKQNLCFGTLWKIVNQHLVSRGVIM